MRFLLPALTILSAAACSQAAGPQSGEIIQFACAGGKTISVRYDAEADTATVEAGGQTYTLAHTRSASGGRYKTGGVEFWDYQGEATLGGAAGGPYEGCRAS